jgi:iron complex outermembrane receptor protein/outer membrane receptor for ferric coprogen and ferric-rhodotorulic acid
MQGSGNPSGAINLVRKRPTREFQLKGEVGAGSLGRLPCPGRCGRPAERSRHAARPCVAYANNGNSYKTGSGKDNQLLYGILEADLSRTPC